MKNNLVLTVISDDKPGIVEVLAQTIADHGGNWQESRMSHLAGKFAGILRVSTQADQLEPLRQALDALNAQGLKIVVESAVSPTTKGTYRELSFNAVGNDRPGIVREIAQALANRQINVDELQTDYGSMPWSGEPLFQARGQIQVPMDVDLDELHDQLDTIADELAIDIDVELPEKESE